MFGLWFCWVFSNADSRHSLSSLMTANLFVVPYSLHKLGNSVTCTPAPLNRLSILSIPYAWTESW